MAGSLKTYKTGVRAEALAEILLRVKGYRILGRRVKTPVGEIDLVARKGNVLVFVEVKRRRGKAAALEALGGKGQKRIARAAAYYLAGAGRGWSGDVRFDLVALWRFGAAHLRNAWDAGGV